MNKIISFFSQTNIFELGWSFLLYHIGLFLLPGILLFFFGADDVARSNLLLKALLYVVLGLTAFAAGYFLIPSLPDRWFVFGRRLFRLDRDWRETRTRLAFTAVFILSIGIKLIRIFGGAYSHVHRNLNFTSHPLYSLVGFLDILAYAVLAIAFIRYFSLKKNKDNGYRFWQRLAWGAMFLELVYAVPSCSRLGVIAPILIYLIIRSYFWKLSYKFIIGAIILFFLVIMPFGRLCRAPVYVQIADPAGYQGVRESVIKSYPSFIYSSIISRANQITIFKKILELNRPLLWGRPMLQFFTSLGPPRFIWKNKPLPFSENTFGRDIGLLHESDYTTSYGATHFGDLYLNFGRWGVILGMFLLGLLWRNIHRFFFLRLSASALMIYSLFWVQMLKGLETEMALVYAGLVKQFVLLLMVVLAL